MIDASKGYFKDGNKNRLRAQDIHKIVDVFNKQIEIPKYSRMVPFSEISDQKNDYNLNISRYINSQEEEDLQDIEAHLLGDIPNKDVEDLSAYWNVCPSLKNTLFRPSTRKGYSALQVEQSKIKPTILENPEFCGYSKKVEGKFKEWQSKIVPVLKDLTIGSKPRELIFNMSESILSAFSNDALIGKYDVYQLLMNYWTETMQDDLYLVAVNGWKVEINVLRNKKGKATGWDCDLIPKKIMIDKYFSKEQEEIDKLSAEVENIIQQMQALEEENSGEDDLFAEARNDNGKITKGEIAKRIREIKGSPEFADELKVLQGYFGLTEKEAEVNLKTNAAEADLGKKLLLKYKGLKEDETRALVVEDKWIKSLYALVKSEMERISQKLAGRVRELAERYETPLPKLTKEVEERSRDVENHLKNMGFKW
jgi:type I restriction enzyme M protein